MNKEIYDSIPVHYCSNCLSLKIRTLGQTDDVYCDECGSTDILTSSIHEWEELYKQKYGHSYLKKSNKNGRTKEK